MTEDAIKAVIDAIPKLAAAAAQLGTEIGNGRLGNEVGNGRTLNEGLSAISSAVVALNGSLSVLKGEFTGAG